MLSLCQPLCICAYSRDSHLKGSNDTMSNDQSGRARASPSCSCRCHDDGELSAVSSKQKEQPDLRYSLKRRQLVRFGVVHIREYGVTVGAYTATNVTCPLQLTWEYAPKETCLPVEDHQAKSLSKKLITSATRCDIHEIRNNCVLPPQPLSAQARRERIARVQGTSQWMIAQLERDLALDMIQETMDAIGALRRCQQAPELEADSNNNPIDLPL
jgi:hypothetical protein